MHMKMDIYIYIYIYTHINVAKRVRDLEARTRVLHAIRRYLRIFIIAGGGS